MLGFRLPDGGRIDRSRPLSFRFNGEIFKGFRGDTLASALIANGQHLVARSFKYHRPRGIVSAGAEEPNAIVQLGIGARTVPNVPATQIELFDGLIADSVNCWPSVKFDVNAVLGWFGKFFPAGFYYKTFMSSPWAWTNLYEPMIRRFAGWGRAPMKPDPDFYGHKHVHCDVLVVGAGPAGLAAASAAASGGARTIIADEEFEFGGSLLSTERVIDGKAGADWAAETTAALAGKVHLTCLIRTTVFGYYDQNYLVAVERLTDHADAASSLATPRARLWHIRAKRVILATGAHERPLVFADNDRPGIMLAGAVQTYANRFAVLAGRRAVLFTNNNAAYEAALDFIRAGGRVAAAVDVRHEVSGDLPDRLRAHGVEILAGHGIARVVGVKRVRQVIVRALDRDQNGFTGGSRSFSCDLVMVSGGRSPVAHLFSQSRGKLHYEADRGCFVPGTYTQDAACVGGCNGTFRLADALTEAGRVGSVAAGICGFATEKARDEWGGESDEPWANDIEPFWLVPSGRPRGQRYARHFVDLQNDTTAADIHLAAREGFESVEHMKRYTLIGFGTDQGKTGNINGLAILSEVLGQSIPETGTTTFRAPYTPVPFGALAGSDVGELNDPIRVTSIHDWHVESGAVFEDVGQWKRPRYYPLPGEDMRAAVCRECLAVRNGVGMLDASTLGKIDIQGPDAVEFLNRIYTNDWLKLPVGGVRYGLMCREDGTVFDDGTTSHLSENRFLMTTTTGGAAGVLEWLEEYLQTEWPELDVYCTSVTEQWATVAIAGPTARNVLAEICSDIELDRDRFPHMTFREGTVAGIQARVFRVSFTGELSYEINVPWYYGHSLWKAVVGAGAEYGITPYGTETMHLLRAEKGFIIVGQETDGTTAPQDLRMGWIVSKKKKDFIGKRSYTRSDNTRNDRKQLVGIVTETPDEVLPEGAQLVADPSAATPVPMLGHVTSSYYSASLGHSIALAMIKSDGQRIGGDVYAPLENKVVKAHVVAPVFYDPKGDRRDG